MSWCRPSGYKDRINSVRLRPSAGTELTGEGKRWRDFPNGTRLKIHPRGLLLPLARVAFDEQALVNQVAQCENRVGSSQVVCQLLEWGDQASGDIASHPTNSPFPLLAQLQAALVAKAGIIVVLPSRPHAFLRTPQTPNKMLFLVDELGPWLGSMKQTWSQE